MSSPPSNFDQSRGSEAFSRLHHQVQKWIWQQNWNELRDVQEQAIAPILSADQDVIISAATAGGKTEAAFLPIISQLMSNREAKSLRVLCLSPLKALINDQFDRLEGLCEKMNIPVYRWHGDVGVTQKKKLLSNPNGILLITPESLEAIFVNRGPESFKLFRGLTYTVIDELHAFIGSERGRQLQSLIHRVETVAQRRIPRIALSATLGDMDMAADFLRPGKAQAVKLLISRDGGQELRLQVRGYLASDPLKTKKQIEKELSEGRSVTMEEIVTGDHNSIGGHLYHNLRGTTNLIFANTRQKVEIFTDLLRRRCDRERVPNEFFAHHGSLSREIREEAEEILKKRERPASIVCTNTLELGIDIGSVTSIAQVGSPPSVAAMRQRMGRSGRKKGQPSILLVYITEAELNAISSLNDQLRLGLVQSVAMVNLMIKGWNEPPDESGLHLSTLVQQLLSVIAQRGGATASFVWSLLCETGPFQQIDISLFARFLKDLGGQEILEQATDGTLLLGELGERIVENYRFYAAFSSPEEYRVVTGSKVLGSLPIDSPLIPDTFLIFAGLRWLILAVDEEKKIIEVKPAPGGRPPPFTGGLGASLHREIRQEMLSIYKSNKIPVFLDKQAQGLLKEGRDNFTRFGLNTARMVQAGIDTHLIFWEGDRAIHTIWAMLAANEIKALLNSNILTLEKSTLSESLETINTLIQAGSPDVFDLALAVQNKVREKHDWLLSEDLLCRNYASLYLDAQGAWEALNDLLTGS